jgi:prepilin-type N-terminal cleavage/methylation domain-containing protein
MRQRLRSGLTLLEVLVAVAIAGVAITVLASGYMNVLLGYRTVEDTSDTVPDIAFARQQVLLAETREDAEKAGDTTRSNGEPLRWQATLEPSDAPDVFRVKLEIELGRPSPAEPLKITQEFWTHQPNWGVADESARIRDEFRKRIEDGRRSK